MAGIDALAAAAALDASLAAQIDAELAQLASDAQALRALLVEDMVVTARVLPSNGLTDLVEIAGRRVAASLPPTVRPGDVVQMQVTGFDGDRILLQVVGTGAEAAVESPSVPPSSSAVAVAANPDAAVTVSSPAAGGSAKTSDPFAGTGTGTDVPPAVPRAQPGAAFSSAVSRANVASSGAARVAQVPSSAGSSTSAPSALSAAAGSMRQPVAPPATPTSIEARVAAARAAAAASAADHAAPDVSAPTRAATVPQRFVAPPQIESRAVTPPRPRDATNDPPSPAKIVAAPSQAKSGTPMTSAANASPNPIARAASRGSQLSAYAEPVALLRALRLPVTPSNVGSATLALQKPERLPDALAALERALPQASADPNVATLRTLLAFVGRIDPRSPALAAQIAAYVDHVVDGAEPKVATLLAASRAANADADRADDTTANEQSGSDVRVDPKPLAAAVAAERGAALNADLKQSLMTLAANPATPDSVAPSLADALSALTAVQMTAAQTLAANPNGLAFTIPLTTPHGTSNAHISVKRDAPDGRGGARLDAENFRIAFVLETAHYGTVAIDLVTVGREVTVDVRTEAAPAMRAFRDALGTLTARLESLRYRVASAGASVGTTSTVAVEAPPSRPVDPDAAVDRSA